MKEYNNVPAKTVEAWRNLWFHTGDAGEMDEEGYLYFRDRVKDVIRRRGETSRRSPSRAWQTLTQPLRSPQRLPSQPNMAWGGRTRSSFALY